MTTPVRSEWAQHKVQYKELEIDGVDVTSALAALPATTSSAAELNLLDGSIAGTTVASKALAVGADKNIDVLALPVGGLRIGAGAGTALTPTAAEINTLAGILATVAELNRAADVSTRIVSLDAVSLAITELLHDGKTVLMIHTAATSTCTLPAATGSGARFRFVVGAVNTNNHVIKVTGNDVMYGNIVANSTADTPDLAQPWPTAADSDTITLNGTDQGGLAVGDWVELEDIATDKWAVRGVVTCNGTEATPFSATVA